MIKETTTTANMAVSGNNIDNNSKSMVLKSMKDNYYYTLVEKLEKLTGKKVVLEKKSKPRSYGCVMLFFEFNKLKSIQNKIDKEDLYDDEPGYGLEKDSHITLLYGLHSKEIKNDENIFDTILNFEIPTLELYNVSLFKKEEYDVLKFEVRQKKKDYSKKNDILYRMNKKISDRFPNTNTYSNYHPHSTIAYLKPGKGKKYVDMFKDKTYVVEPDEIVYSRADGETKKEKINESEEKAVTLLEKKSKYLKVKDHVAKMHIPAELKEKILDLVNSGTRVSDKHPIIHGLTKPADFNKKVKEHNLPTGYELGADKNGFFVATHRARSKSYENVVDIPIKSIKFIDSTG